MVELLTKHVDPAGKRIAVLGLVFKSGADDIRNSRAIPLVQSLLELDALVVAYDPVAVDNMREEYPDIEYAESAATTITDADGALVVTD